MLHPSSAQAQNNSLEIRIQISILQLPSNIDLLASKDTTTYPKEVSDGNKEKIHKSTKVPERNITHDEGIWLEA